ncbi:hypothetical protein VE02_08367 [Pseudogymnoascus sp. 03VT05]|nr:hypothetical protein VE02_08367 [Pseudogymnoascus sp. 03VT05]
MMLPDTRPKASMDKYVLPCEPLASPDAVVAGANYRFTLLGGNAIRYEWSCDGQFEDRASTFAINRRFPVSDYYIRDEDNQLEIITPSFHLSYDKKRFSPNGLTVSIRSKVTLWGSEWRYGSDPENNLGGTARTLDEVDGRCDLGAGIISRSGYASLDDSNSMLFDGKGFVEPRRPGDRVDGYLFHYGHDFKGAMKSFYAISGSQPQLPRWALGNWWSRYYAYSAEEYISLMDKFSERGVPLSVAVIDMDWHLVDDERVPHTGWTGYTWNKTLFPDPSAFSKELHDRKLKITLNDHPHAGVHHHEDAYQEMALALNHDTTKNGPIMFDSTCPQFMNAYLNILHRGLENIGCDFWWIDWQQGASSRVPGLDPLWLLNHFQFLDTAAAQTIDQPLIFSRYAGPGSHRYPVGFSGDSIATWASFAFQPEFTATASNIGYGWWSHDIGGHMKGERDDELVTRWVQFGAFSPILRLHSSDSRWASKEPWLYGKDSEAIIQRFMQFRHRLLPYIYTANIQSATSYEPLIQPMYWSFPSRNEAYEVPNQYYFGSQMIVAPIVKPRDNRTGQAMVKGWIPPLRHVDIFTGTVYDGDRELNMYRSLEQMPVLAAEGSIIPLDGKLVPDNGCGNPGSFEVFVVVGRDGGFTILEDPQDDMVTSETGLVDQGLRATQIQYTQSSGQLRATVNGGQWTFRFLSMTDIPSSLKVTVSGSDMCDADITVENYPLTPSMVVRFHPLTEGESELIINLGPSPQLSVLDHSRRISDLLLKYQTEFEIKDRIWALVSQADRPAAVKIGGLLSMSVDEALIGPVGELMCADSRGL